MGTIQQDLIRRSQAGDPEAFGSLFDAYKNLVYRLAYLMLGSPEEAEDALQEVFLQVYRSLASYQETRAAFTTWLYRVTLNHCLNRRRRWRYRLLPFEAAHSRVQARERSAGDWEDAECVHQALLRLSERLRAVVVLRYYAGLSYAEIAQSLEIPLGTVKSRLDKGLRTLREELGADFDPLWGNQEVRE
jgi:RNA polymerase sigma-70 factor (ECF subfamily)